MPEFSIIIPSYNHAKYIEQAITSVLTQSFHDLELLIIDDGSSDDSVQIISAFADPRLRVFPQSNQGAHAAINRGIHASSGKYIAILNSDDTYAPDRLQKIKDAFTSQPAAGLIGSYINLIDARGNSLGIKEGFKNINPWTLDSHEKSFRAGESLHSALLTENYLATTSNFVFARECFDAVGDFRPLRYAHDWDFALRAARQFPISLLPEPLVNYRVHETNTIRENRAAMIFEIAWCLAVHLPRYTSDSTLFNPASALDVETLLNSIYIFDMDKMLSLMLLQRLSEDEPLAVALLQADNPVRQQYLNFIAQELNKTLPAAAPQNKLVDKWNKLFRKPAQ